MFPSEVHRTSQKIKTSEERVANSINAILNNISNRLTVVADLRSHQLPHIDIARYATNCRVLQLADDHGFNEIYAVLSDAWINTPVKIGMPVNIYGHFSEDKDSNGGAALVICITQKQPCNYIVLYPNRCLAVTGLKEASNCDRKTYLKQLYSTLARQNNIAATRGTIYHNVFELVLLGYIDENDEEKTAELVSQQILRESDFFLSPQDEAQLRSLKREMMAAARKAFQFKNTYMANRQPIAYKQGKIIIESLVDTEHAFNSYNFGFSGKVDVLFKCRYYSNINFKGSKEIYVPFELKTGKHKDHIFYNDQAMIYNFCLHEEATKDGLSMVYYSIDDDIIVIENDFKAFGNALRGRNYAVFVIHGDKPPKVLKDKHMCNNCIQINNCTVEYLKDRFDHSELRFRVGSQRQSMSQSLNGLRVSEGQGNSFFSQGDRDSSMTKRRTRVEMASDRNGDDASTKKHPVPASIKDDDLAAFMDELSNQEQPTSAQHDELYDKNADLDIEDLLKEKVGMEDRIRELATKNKLKYRNIEYISRTLKAIATDESHKKTRAVAGSGSSANNYCFSFSNLQTLIRIVSDKELKDSVKSVTPELEVRINRTTRNDIDDVLNDFHRDKVIVLYNSVIFHLKLEGKIRSRTIHQYAGYCVLRLFLETSRKVFETFVREFNGAYNSKYYGNWLMVKDQRYYYPLMRLNLVHLFTYDNHEDLVRLLLRSYDNKLIESLSQNADETNEIKALGISLNDDQLKAVLSCYLAKFFWLVNGYSGTGKKRVIAALLKLLLAKDKRTLLVGNTFSAINAILAFLGEYLTAEQKEQVLRLMGGSQGSQIDFPSFNGSSSQTLADIQEYNKKTVYCTSIMSLAKCRFKDFDFDYVIVVEASDITATMALQALYLGRKVVLVGDSQLSTVSCEGVAGGLDYSLFDALYKKYPSSVAQLSVQYKHPHEISAYLNVSIYRDKLVNAENTQLKTQVAEAAQTQSSWLSTLLARNLVLLNTEGLAAKKTDFKFTSAGEGSVTNHPSLIRTEIEKAIDVYTYYVDCSISHSDVLVVVEDYSQQAVIKEHIDKADVCLLSNVKGRNKEIVLLVLCLENLVLNSSESRRLIGQINYVVARAKLQVVVIVNLDKIRHSAYFKDILAAIEDKGLVLDIKKEEISQYIDACPF